MPVDFAKAAVHKTKAEDPAYRKRQRREGAREVAAMDSEFWLCACFRTAGALGEFLGLLGLGGGERRLIPGSALREATERFRPERPSLAFPRPREAAPRGDLFASLEYTGWLEADALMELCVLHDALNGGVDPGEPEDVTESPHWACFYFRSREDKDDYLHRWSLRGLGDKYLDGDEWLGRLRCATGSTTR